MRSVSLGKRRSLVELAIRLVTDATCVGTTCDVIWSIDRTVQLQPRITLGVGFFFVYGVIDIHYQYDQWLTLFSMTCQGNYEIQKKRVLSRKDRMKLEHLEATVSAKISLPMCVHNVCAMGRHLVDLWVCT